MQRFTDLAAAAAPRYLELRSRSAFSFLAGASLPEDLIDRAAALGYGALALGDRDGVYGAPRFHKAAQRAGIHALIGCELSVEAVRVLRCYAAREKQEESITANTLTASNLLLLVLSRIGYQNLCRILTDAKLRAPKGEAVVTWEDLEGRTDGLICLYRPTAALQGVGVLSGYAVTGRRSPPLTANTLTPNSLGDLVGRLRRFFPNRLYLDLQRHLDPDEERLNRALIDVARHCRIPLVATNDVCHATPAGRPLLDVLTCIREHTSLDAAGRRLLKNAERHLKSPREMATLFRDLPDAISNTQRIAEQCEFTLTDLGYRFPEYPLPPGETPIGYLRALTHAGARERYGHLTPKIRRQLEHELQIIGRLDLAGYFLIVWDIVRFCREQRILAQGRGSAANSAVCYALGITAVDAVGMELLFERFLSAERGEWPDIDIDLPSGDQREKVIQYVYQRYGDRGAAMTANVITYRTRSAVREVGKALGFTIEQVDKLSKLLHRFEFRDDMDELAKQLKTGGVDPTAPRVGLLVDLVGQIQNLPRHLGQHSGGMVIAAGRLDHVVPLEPAAMPGRVVVQWDKDDCADLGIIKVDLLGLGMMAVLEETIPLIREHEGVDLDLAHLPPDDPTVYGMLQRADTIGVFQVESRAQMATLPRMKPERFYDLVVEVAIIRPGPIVGQMVHPYLNRRNGREPVTYAHPDLEPILKRTLGVPLFQEQLLRMAMTVAGFTGGEAEELRRAMGFKRSTQRMQQIEARLRAGMAEKGIIGKAADDIVRSITSFALYGFPESHAASFALLAYASAYLRAHHPAAFTCALLNNWPMGFYHPATIIKDAQRHDVRVLPIDVTRSNVRCTLEREVVGLLGCYAVREDSAPPLTANTLTPNTLSLRLGLKFVTGLRAEAGKRIETERTRAPFTSIADVIHRCELRDPEVQALAHIGAFAAFDLTRREALWQAAAVPREPLLARQAVTEQAVTLLGCYAVRDEEKAPATAGSRRSNAPEGRKYGTVGTALVQKSPRVAAGNETGEGMLPLHEGIPEGGVVRSYQPDSASSDVSASEYRGGQWSGNKTGLRQLPADCPRQSSGTGDIPPAGYRSDSRLFGDRVAAFATSGFDSATAEPLDPIAGEAFSGIPNNLTANTLTPCPLPTMSAADRTLADYAGTGLTTGPHIMKYLREQLTRDGVLRSIDLRRARDGRWVKIAGLVIVRQRPGTAKGFCFLTLEDETGTANAVVVPDMFQRHRALIHTAALLQVEGPIQKVSSGDGKQVPGSDTRHPTPDTQFVIHVRARRFIKLAIPQQVITQAGHGYRMRTTPTSEPLTTNNQQANNPLPKSHDFR